MVNLYSVLGVSSAATTDEIKKAFKKIASENHPDRFPGDEKREAKFKEASAAYTVLSSEENRKKYDKLLREQSDRVKNIGLDASEILRAAAAKSSKRTGSIMNGLASAFGIVSGANEPTAENLKDIFDGSVSVAQWISDLTTDGGRGDGT